MLTGIFQPLLLVLLAVAAAASPADYNPILGLPYDIVADGEGTAVAVAPAEVTPAPTPTTLNIGERQCLLCGIQSST
ncbi:hypothetical protein B0H13DRAFT_2371472 [Mycena leptocephala]|nr:hypothetical protein B0H13DRAFT_2371472 [Mycena leptocephala]